MNKLLLLLVLLVASVNASAQSFTTDKFPRFTDYYDRIDLYDEHGSPIVSVAPKFYKHQHAKEWIKPIKVDGSTYFIKRGKSGLESVYTKDGHHVALMSRNRATIHLIEGNQKYSFKPRLKLANFNVLECRNSEGVLVSTTSFNSNRTLTYVQHQGQHPNFLLMSLCTHQYQELLLGGRGRLSSLNNGMVFINSALLSLCE